MSKERVRFGSPRTGIRPIPPGANFDRLCDGRCKGNTKCRFPHSKEEQAAWKRLSKRPRHSKSSGSLTVSRSLAQCPTPQLQSHQRPVLSHQQPLTTTTPSFPRKWSEVVKSKLVEPVKLVKPAQLVETQESQKTAEQNELSKSVEPVKLAEPSLQMEPLRESPGESSKTVEPLEPMEPIQPLEPLKQSDDVESAAATFIRKPHNSHHHHYHHHRQSSKSSQVELTRDVYKKKFHSLLNHEEEEHDRILKEKCDCQCTLVLSQAGIKPDWLNPRKHKFVATYIREHCFGYLDGLNSDQITYVTQASQGATLQFKDGKKVKIDIVPENYEHTEQKLYIAMNKIFLDLDIMDGTNLVDVKFILKYSYFRSLHRALTLLPEESIESLVPQRSDFTPVSIESIPSSIYERLKLYNCSTDQMTALKSIISCPSDGPPVLVCGSFGTGKTRLLAIAVHYFLQEQQPAKQPVRVLVCAQQHVSADAFLEYFTKELVVQDDNEVCIARFTTDGYYSYRFKKWYMDIDQFDTVKHKTKILVVTTCMTAKNLANAKSLSPGFFTHVLLDEGAQMREPEAVASLCLAGPNTKIVIAGDQNQVGPETLVLGEEARRYGLQKSLLERLFTQYRSMGVLALSYCSTLTTNFRCKLAILKLASELFYGSSLVCKDTDTKSYFILRKNKRKVYPLTFVCSSIDESVCHIQSATNEAEARIVLQEVEQIVTDWPVDGWGYTKNLDDVAVVSPHRSQITLIGKLLNSKEENFPSKLKKVRRIPTFVIQGHEFRAVFISTSEPTEQDGSTCNPTKSVCDRYVFNTTLTRARSLVVAVGNPFLLLKIEKHMVKKYGEAGRCWSEFFKVCLENDSFIIDSSINASQEESDQCLQKLRTLIKVSNVAGPTLQPHIQYLGEPQLHAGTAQQLKSQVEDITNTSELQGASQSGIVSRLKEKYDVIELMGEGSFGVVFHVKHKTDKHHYAVKVVRLTKGSEKKKTKEVEVLANLTHHGIVRYYDSSIEEGLSHESWTCLQTSSSLSDELHSVNSSTIDTQDQTSDGALDSSDSVVTFQNSQSGSVEEKMDVISKKSSQNALLATACYSYLFIRTELCEKETLKDWLWDHITDRSRQKVLKYFQQILDAVGYIHEQRMVHRDLKPSNIFFSRDEKLIKVGDFGLVTATDSHDVYPSSESESRSLKGTSFYMSPEQMDCEKCDNKADVFALGVIFFELHCPFKKSSVRKKIMQELMKGKFPENFDASFDAEAKLIKKMLMDDSSSRPTVVATSEELKVIQDNVVKIDEEIGEESLVSFLYT